MIQQYRFKKAGRYLKEGLAEAKIEFTSDEEKAMVVSGLESAEVQKYLDNLLGSGSYVNCLQYFL